MINIEKMNEIIMIYDLYNLYLDMLSIQCNKTSEFEIKFRKKKCLECSDF